MSTTQASVTFAYKSNPAKYESMDSGITLPVPEGMTPGVCMAAARAMVFTTLGMTVTKSDRIAAKKYLTTVYGADAKLSDFADTKPE